MLDFIGTIVLVAAIIASINALTGAMPISTSQRIAVSVGAGLWTGLAAALAGANLFLGTNPLGPPVIGTVIATPLVATAVAASISPSVRASLLGMPMPFLIALNVWRLAGGFFLLLAAEGRLAGPFPYSAGWGDIITGAFALPVAWLALRGQGRGDGLGLECIRDARSCGCACTRNRLGERLAAADDSRRGRLGRSADAAVVADSDRLGADVPDRARCRFRPTGPYQQGYGGPQL
jgi:hypothetical protein